MFFHKIYVLQLENVKITVTMSSFFPQGVIYKVGTLRFCNFRPLFPPVHAHTLLAFNPLLIVRTYWYGFLKMWQKYIL